MGNANFEVFQIEEAKMNIMSEYITGIIDKYRTNSLFEGAYFMGCDGNLVILHIVYNHSNFFSRFEDVSLDIRERNRIRDMCGLDLRVESISNWEFSTESSKKERSGYTHEFELRHGTILYDANGNLAKMKEKLEEDEDLATYLNYWRGPCLLEPPVRYIKEP